MIQKAEVDLKERLTSAMHMTEGNSEEEEERALVEAR
jgi:hypothetical protein